MGAVDEVTEASAALAGAVLDGRDARDEANAVRHALARLEEVRKEPGGHAPPEGGH
jgi:hypothetical protein